MACAPFPMRRSSRASSQSLRSQSHSNSNARTRTSRSRSRSRSNSRSTRSSGRADPCNTALSCLSSRSPETMEEEQLSAHAIILREWIERELPPIEMPDPMTLEALLTGNGRAIFEYLVSRVVSPKRAEHLRAALALEHKDDNRETGNNAEIEELEREAEALDREIDLLRSRIRDATRNEDSLRLGLDKTELRAALVNAAMDELKQGTESCDKYVQFLGKNRIEASNSEGNENVKERAVEDLGQLLLKARSALAAVTPPLDTNANSESVSNAGSRKERVTTLNSDIEAFCEAYSLEAIAKAVHKMSLKAQARKEVVLKQRDAVSESTVGFAKRLGNELRDKYLNAFAESEKSAENVKRVLFDGEESNVDDEKTERELAAAANALVALDHTLSQLTEGSRERISRLLANVKHIDSVLLDPLQENLTMAHSAQHARLDADLAMLSDAQSLSLVDAMHPPACMHTRDDLDLDVHERAAFDGIRDKQNAVKYDSEAKCVRKLLVRAQKEAEQRARVEERAAMHVIPVLQKSTAAAKHAHQHTVPSAKSEVAMASKVDAFVAARTEGQR